MTTAAAVALTAAPAGASARTPDVLAAATATAGPVDTTPPSLPGAPTASNLTPTGFTATWGPATDNVGVTGYLLLLTGPSQGVSQTVLVTGLTYTFTNLAPGGYSIGAAAVDAAGNKSLFVSHPVIIMLPTAAPPTSTPPTSAPPPGGCVASYRIVSQWTGGFQGEVTVRNTTATAFQTWTASWTFANGQRINQLWNGSFTQSGANVSATHIGWNSLIPPGGSQVFGFLGSSTGTNTAPTPTCVGS
jgi:mannan endo-1,4-beta-mannosidase